VNYSVPKTYAAISITGDVAKSNSRTRLSEGAFIWITLPFEIDEY